VPRLPRVGFASVLPNYRARCSNLAFARQYALEHAAILRGDAPQYRLVSVLVEGGLGDRIAGLFQEFWLAVFTHRALLITSYADGSYPMWEAGFSSAFVEWSAPEPPPDLSYPLQLTWPKRSNGRPRGVYNASAVNITKYHGISLINERTPDWYRNIDVNDLHMAPAPGSPNNRTKAEVVLMCSNRGAIALLLANPRYAPMFAGWGLNMVNTPACTFEALFTPSSAVVSQYTNVIAQIVADQRAVKISINLRAGDYIFDKTAHKDDEITARIHRRLYHYFYCASEISKFTRLGENATRPVVWYFTSESLAIRRYVASIFRDANTSTANYTRYGVFRPQGDFRFVVDTETEYYHGNCRSMLMSLNSWFFRTTPEQRRRLCPEAAQNLSIVHAAGQLFAMARTLPHTRPD